VISQLRPKGELMKCKISLLIEENVVRLAKRRAAKEGRPLSHLIQDAVERYLGTTKATPVQRAQAYYLFCEQPMTITRTQLRHILDEDMWNE
jgi:hypothetical protein